LGKEWEGFKTHLASSDGEEDWFDGLEFSDSSEAARLEWRTHSYIKTPNSSKRKLTKEKGM